MKRTNFDSAEAYEPDEGWRRVSLAGSEQFTFEWFEKPPGHSSPMHHHKNEQVCIVLQGELTVHTEDRSVTLGRYDSVKLDAWESHRVENSDEERVVAIDVFAPGREFDFWTDQNEE